MLLKEEFLLEQFSFYQWLNESGELVIPLLLLEKIELLDISPENLGYLVLGLAQSRKKLSSRELANDRWIKWCLSEGWAQWKGKGEDKYISFDPLWRRVYHLWTSSGTDDTVAAGTRSDFQYSKILKWLDKVRGNLSVTLREKQVIQEFNLNYGWSADFILIFLQLVFERGFNKVQQYEKIARRVYENGIDTVECLVSFTNELDWTHSKVEELKKCIGQYGGVTRIQREMYLKWTRQWNLSHELVIKAGEEAARSNNPSFRYIDAVLKNWHEKGVRTVDDAEKIIRQRGKTPEQSIPGKSGGKRSNIAEGRDLEQLFKDFSGCKNCQDGGNH